MKYLESNFVCVNVVISIKMNTLSYRIKYLSCLLVNFHAAIYRNLLLAKFKLPWACRSHPHLYNEKVPFALQRACCSAENPFSHNSHTVIKSFIWIINFYSYQVHQCSLANILIDSRVKSLSNICGVLQIV